MLFNSYAFIFVFLPIVFTGFFLFARADRRVAVAWLAAASLVFYGWWSARYVPLLVASAAANFAFGAFIFRHRGQRAGAVMLVAAVAANLALLGYFKYANFFLDSVAVVLGRESPALAIVLPLGISFYTFTQIAFLVDVRRGRARDYRFTH